MLREGFSDQGEGKGEQIERKGGKHKIVVILIPSAKGPA